MVEWVKAQRELYRTVMLVKPWKTAGSDHMGIIELDETGHDRQGRRGDGGGVLRPLRWYPGRHPHGHERHLRGPAELTAVTARTTEEQTEAINNGKLILIHDGIQAKIAGP